MLKIIAKAAIKYEFSSTQIDFSPNIAKRIISWGKNNIPDSDIYDEEEKYGRENEIHCTIKYDLHTNDIRKIKNKVKEFGKFDIELGEISRFVPKEKDYDVVKIAVEGERLHELNKILSELENSDKFTCYKPHVTIAYINKGTNSNLSGLRPFDGEKISVTEITFSPKNGQKETVSLE